MADAPNDVRLYSVPSDTNPNDVRIGRTGVVLVDFAGTFIQTDVLAGTLSGHIGGGGGGYAMTLRRRRRRRR